jgi:5'-3' exonuclease
LDIWHRAPYFDGQSPTEKAPKHAQRQKSRKDNDESVVVTPLFVGMCIRVCQRYYFNYVVAPYEADVQVGRHESAIAVTRDSDLIAYRNRQLLIVDSYNKQEWRFIDMTVPLTDENKGKYPLYAHYKR